MTCYKKNRIYSKLPDAGSIYTPISKEELDLIPNQNRINVKTYTYFEDRPWYFITIENVYEGITKYIRTGKYQKFDPSLFLIGIKEDGACFSAVYHVPHTMTIRRLLIECGFFDVSLYYYVGKYLLTENTIEKTIKELHEEENLPERAIIIMRRKKPFFPQSKMPDSLSINDRIEDGYS